MLFESVGFKMCFTTTKDVASFFNFICAQRAQRCGGAVPFMLSRKDRPLVVNLFCNRKLSKLRVRFYGSGETGAMYLSHIVMG